MKKCPIPNKKMAQAIENTIMWATQAVLVTGRNEVGIKRKGSQRYWQGLFLEHLHATQVLVYRVEINDQLYSQS